MVRKAKQHKTLCPRVNFVILAIGDVSVPGDTFYAESICVTPISSKTGTQ